MTQQRIPTLYGSISNRRDISDLNTNRTVLVCGGRTYSDYQRLCEVLDQEDKAGRIILLVHGGASGADKMAGRWALDRGIAVKVYEADWAQYGRSAGPRRNEAMLGGSRPDLVVAFPGGTGTADMVRRARAVGTPVLVVA